MVLAKLSWQSDLRPRNARHYSQRETRLSPVLSSSIWLLFSKKLSEGEDCGLRPAREQSRAAYRSIKIYTNFTPIRILIGSDLRIPLDSLLPVCRRRTLTQC